MGGWWRKDGWMVVEGWVDGEQMMDELIING